MRDAEPVRRVVVSAFGGPEQLTLETAAEPRLIAPSELLVDVEASGINYLDVYQRSGTYQLRFHTRRASKASDGFGNSAKPLLRPVDSPSASACHGSMLWDHTRAKWLCGPLKRSLCPKTSQLHKR